jgi:DNA-binding response OmpR family regulator
MPTPIRILVIEDDAMIAVAVGMILQDQGWIVVGPIGRLDLAIEAAVKAEFDCAVVDAQLNGEYADRVALNLHRRGKPFLMATGHNSEDLPAELRRAPMLRKPFSTTDLVDAVREMVPDCPTRRGPTTVQSAHVPVCMK